MNLSIVAAITILIAFALLVMFVCGYLFAPEHNSIIKSMLIGTWKCLVLIASVVGIIGGLILLLSAVVWSIVTLMSL